MSNRHPLTQHPAEVDDVRHLLQFLGLGFDFRRADNT